MTRTVFISHNRADKPLYSAAAKPSGFVVYEGPSMLDGAPIVCILTGLGKQSTNEKTGGGLYQTWILRSDVNPIAATHSGDDASVCGDCKHRGTVLNGKNVNRSCYVTLFQAPRNVWESYHRGIYPRLPMNAAREALRGRVRGGSYGDPAAVPFHVWQALLHDQPSGTAYTHQWRRFPELAAFCMASVDNEQEKMEANLLGFRTFRVRGATDPTLPREVVCPASKEANHRTTCDKCLACGGNRAKARADIVIVVHGAAGKMNAFNSNQRG